ncbi:MAG: ATP-binding protein [Marinosulfonomonas sp.]
MNFEWLKRYVPRGIYGRAALILLLPIITLQVVVSVIFIQRHFEDVTRQMTASLVLDLGYLQQEVNSAPTLEAALVRINKLSRPLAMNVTLPSDPAPASDSRGLLDLSGRIVILTLKERNRRVLAVDLTKDSDFVEIWMRTNHGVMSVSVLRGRVSAPNPHQFLVLMLFVSLLMTLVAFVFLRNQLRPIRRLARAATAFGKGRNIPYKPAGALEVRAAGNAFLDMRARIERQIEQRTMMLSGVSHDLRTPITRLKLGLSVMEDVSEAPELIEDVEDMQRLLDEFLAFARGDLLDDLAETDPVALVQTVVEKAVRGGGDVKLGTIEGAGTAMMRPIAVQRALDNLIGNALRYGNCALVDVVLFERAVTISIEDDGPGIPEDQREHALKPFARLDESRNQNKGSGVGLGLSIAHDIARRHGGSLRLGQSDSLGGLKVDLVLPR